jgi:hypothetical protein
MNPLYFLISYPLNISRNTVCAATEIFFANLTKHGTGVPAFSSVGSLSPVFLQTVKYHDLLRHLSFCFVCFRIKQEACNAGRIGLKVCCIENACEMSAQYWNDRDICFAPF